MPASSRTNKLPATEHDLRSARGDDAFSSLGEVAQSKWVIRATAAVEADIDSVVAWWRDPRRNDDMVAFLEKGGGRDIVIEKSETAVARVRDVRFKTAGGAEIRQRLETKIAPEGTTGDKGSVYVIRSRHEDRILFPSGREVTCACSVSVEFAPIDPGSTRITETHDQRKSGVAWWERFLPPNSERARLNRRLRDWAELCRIDLGA